MLTEFAPAKLNLYLHITGRRPDGYHDLDSLAVFANLGDELRLEHAHGQDFEFILEGDYAAPLRQEPPTSNLVVKAAQSLAHLTGHTLDGLKLTLTKNLPVASGIGGGSSDAAAALRLLARHWGLGLNDPRLVEVATQHGQDVPVCLTLHNNYITATGTTPAPDLPGFYVVLVNPNKGLSTPSVYKEFREGGYGFSPFAQLKNVPLTLEELVTALKERENDLYDPACKLMQEIRAVIEELDGCDGCMLGRMSGSGATCFGIFGSQDKAEHALLRLRARRSDWWTHTAVVPAHRS